MTAAVTKARTMLQEMGVSKVDGKALLQLPATARAQMITGFNRAATPQVKQQYQQLTSDAAKRDWLAAYLLDPETACSQGVNRTLAIEETLQQGTGSWMHETEIAGPKGINCPILAKKLIDSGELGEGRPSEYESLAAMGVKQFWFCKSRLRTSHGHRQERGVESSAELAGSEAAEVRDSILACASSATPKAGKRKAEKPPEDPRTVADRKRRTELRSQRSSALRRLKTLVDKVANEMTDLKAKLPLLVEKNFPPQMEEWCSQKVLSIESNKDAAVKFYSTEASKVLAADTPIDVLAADITAIDKEISNLSTQHSDWKKGPVKEVEKMVG